MSDITAQRQRALKARRRLTVRKRRVCSRSACWRVARLPVFRRARHIGVYWPMASEADPRHLLSYLRTNQRCYLPSVRERTLRFIAIQPNRFRHRKSPLGIVEPLGGPGRHVDALDLLIMPLAAFDSRMHRIGMGGGFYDRTLAPRSGARGYRRPHLLGLAFQAQQVDLIDTRPWDIDLDTLVTESRVYRAATPGPRAGLDPRAAALD